MRYTNHQWSFSKANADKVCPLLLYTNAHPVQSIWYATLELYSLIENLRLSRISL
ncbi:hypothetical protein PF327_10725 [Sulfurovum sp. XTW-4]|uniref:Uncharacterized protein n=1 Tax=Sulfurovum xiamenensis TaxID=3019066 RepID=A0ABT7QUB8_9BACT|nr:hypothetical protein [Sulfurovum xiamenensis]MDM5264668.1 hypothetical protein [Sulfurovum xiamenensis]